MRVRAATSDDAPAIARVQVASWKTTYRGALPDAYLDDLDTSLARRERHWSTEADTSGAVMHVVEVGDEIVGFAAWGRADDADHPGAGELRAIYLAPEWFGQGAGHDLHEAGLAAMAAAGYPTLVLWVHAGNQRALDFYTDHGWTPDGAATTLPIAETPVPVVRLVRDLRTSRTP